MTAREIDSFCPWFRHVTRFEGFRLDDPPLACRRCHDKIAGLCDVIGLLAAIGKNGLYRCLCRRARGADLASFAVNAAIAAERR